MARLVGSFLVLSIVMVAIVCVVTYCARARHRWSRRCTSVWVQSQTRRRLRLTAGSPTSSETSCSSATLPAGRANAAQVLLLDPTRPPRGSATAQGRARPRSSTTVVRQTTDAQELMLLELERHRITVSTVPQPHRQVAGIDEVLRPEGLSHTAVENPYIVDAHRTADDHGLDAALPRHRRWQRDRRARRQSEPRSGSTGSSCPTTASAPPAPPIWSAATISFVDKILATGPYAGARALERRSTRPRRAGRVRGSTPNYQGVPVIGVYRWLPERNAAHGRRGCARARPLHRRASSALDDRR